jgi:Ca-activated chloride channel family protein
MQIYDAINQLEPQEQEGRFVQETKELFYWPAAVAILLFLLLLKLPGKVW